MQSLLVAHSDLSASCRASFTVLEALSREGAFAAALERTQDPSNVLMVPSPVALASLRAIVSSRPYVFPSFVLRCAAAAARTLRVLHAAGIEHGAVSVDSIFIDPVSGAVVLSLPSPLAPPATPTGLEPLACPPPPPALLPVGALDALALGGAVVAATVPAVSPWMLGDLATYHARVLAASAPDAAAGLDSSLGGAPRQAGVAFEGPLMRQVPQELRALVGQLLSPDPWVRLDGLEGLGRW